MKLIVQPDDGVAPLLSAIKAARKSVELAIFRLDRRDIEDALNAAVSRDIRVHALIASVNRGGEKNLRRLEMRFLEAGITVSRSGDDLVRYHDKLMIIDRRTLLLLSFNFTHADIDRSRGFGIITRNARWVREAVALLESDRVRQAYTPGCNTFVVSPANSRKVLAGFLKRAKTQLLIYDPKISDGQMVSILRERAKAGVKIRIIGQTSRSSGLAARKLAGTRLHTRTIIRDGRQAFVGSQSLRSLELDARREVGLIVQEPAIVRGLINTFESDWASHSVATRPVAEPEPAPPAGQAQQAARLLVQELHPLAGTVKKAIKKAVARAGEEVLEDKMVKITVKKVVKKAVKQAVREAVHDTRRPRRRI